MENLALMARSSATTSSANDGNLLSQIRSMLSPSLQSLTLEQKLEKLTLNQRRAVLMYAQLATMMAATEVLQKGYSTQSYLDIVKKLYRGGSASMQRLIAEVLEEIAPIEVIEEEPAPIADARMNFYMNENFTLPSIATETEEVVTPARETLPLFADENLTDGPDAFLMRIAPKTLIVAKELGIDPRIVAAQAALETGWGKSVKGNNLFGIKSHGIGDGIVFDTHEVVDGERIKVRDSFRQYNSFDDSIEDYGLFLRENKRYQQMLNAKTLDEQIEALAQSGYATDPAYAQKIADIAKSQRLQVLATS